MMCRAAPQLAAAWLPRAKGVLFAACLIVGVFGCGMGCLGQAVDKASPADNCGGERTSANCAHRYCARHGLQPVRGRVPARGHACQREERTPAKESAALPFLGKHVLLRGCRRALCCRPSQGQTCTRSKHGVRSSSLLLPRGIHMARQRQLSARGLDKAVV